jgi:hypothetical protein
MGRSTAKTTFERWSGTEQIRNTFNSQQPGIPPTFAIDEVRSNNLLPGGSPLLDHIIAWCTINKGWESTCETLTRFATQRVPTLDDRRMPEVREIVLTESDVMTHQAAIFWLVRKVAETEKRDGFCLPALDVESLSVDFPGRPNTWETVSEDLLLDECVWASVGTKGVKDLLKLPVLLMYGAPGWQLHIRIPVEYWRDDGKTQVKIKAGTVHVGMLQRVLNAMRPAVGTGIMDDINDFVQAVERIYVVSLDRGKIPKGIPLSHVAMLAGVSHRQSSLLTMVHLVLGGVLAKGWKCSTGDSRWGEPFGKLHPALKAYLHGDIQQVSITASVLVVIWVAHLFPSAKLIKSELGIDPRDFVNIWIKTAVQRDLARLATGQGRLAPGTATNRQDLIRQTGVTTDDQDALLSLSPDWPAITTGGPRSSEDTLAFSKRGINLFRTLYGEELLELSATTEASQPQVVPPAPIQPADKLPTPQAMEHDQEPGTSSRKDPEETTRRDARSVHGATRVQITGPAIQTPEPSARPLPRATRVRVAAPSTSDPEMVGTVQRPKSLRHSTNPVFDLQPKDVSCASLSSAAKVLGVPKRNVLAEYIARDVGRAVALLELIEDEWEDAARVLTPKHAGKAAKDLRLFLQDKGRLRRRPRDWVDPWKQSIQDIIEVRTRHVNHINDAMVDAQARQAAQRHSALVREATNHPVPVPVPNTLLAMPPPSRPFLPARGEGNSKNARKRRNRAIARAAEAARANGMDIDPGAAPPETAHAGLGQERSLEPMDLSEIEVPAVPGPSRLYPASSETAKAGLGQGRESQLSNELSQRLGPPVHEVVPDDNMMEVQKPVTKALSAKAIAKAEFKRRFPLRFVIELNRRLPDNASREGKENQSGSSPMLTTPSPPVATPSPPRKPLTPSPEKTSQVIAREVRMLNPPSPKPGGSKKTPAGPSKEPVHKREERIKDLEKLDPDGVTRTRLIEFSLFKHIRRRKENETEEMYQFYKKVGRRALKHTMKEDGGAKEWIRAPLSGTGWWVYWFSQDRYFVKTSTTTEEAEISLQVPRDLADHPDFMMAAFSRKKAKKVKGAVPILGEEDAHSSDESDNGSGSDSDSSFVSRRSSSSSSDMGRVSGSNSSTCSSSASSSSSDSEPEDNAKKGKAKKKK